MRNLKDMTAKEAVRAAKAASGLTAKEIAAGLSVSTGSIKRYLKEDDPYWPSLEKLPQLCAVLGNTLLQNWIEAQIEEKKKAEREGGTLCSVRNPIEALRNIGLLVGKTKSLTCREEERITAALDEVEFECERIRASLPQRGSCGKKKRFCCPLWRFWERHFSKTPGGQK